MTQTYYLDYTDMILPVAAFNSARNGHFLALLALLTGTFVRIQIFLAPALLHLTVLEMPVLVPLTVHDAFTEPSDILETSDPRPYYSFYGESAYNHSLPLGIANSVSYQTFSQTGDSSVQYKKSEAPLEAEVDALVAELHCLPLDRCDSTIGNVSEGAYAVHYSLYFDGCGEDSDFLPLDTTEVLPQMPGDASHPWLWVDITPGADNASRNASEYKCHSITRTN